MADLDVHRSIEAVWRIESARVIAGIAHVVNDVGLAEELAQDALVAALEQWPAEGIPRNPGAWLMTIGRRRAIDTIRRQQRLERNVELMGRDLENEEAVDTPEDIEDDLLRLVFTACHPILSREARVALALRVLGGLTTDEIARAYLVPESTVAQRIVRAKRSLADAGVPFEVPQGPELAGRLSSVLEVIYLVFNEGYSATAGDDWIRTDLCEEALRLGRMVAVLMPREPEVHGLVALLEIQASRSAARVGPSGEPVLLLEQDRTRWNRLLIRRGLAALERAEALGRADALGRAEALGRADALGRGQALERAEASGGDRGPYTLQAAIAACHARALAPEDTDWVRIAELYAVLARQAPSPIVELNRAVALGLAYGPEAGLRLIDEIATEPSLKAYHLLPSVRGDLLARLGRLDEAEAEFMRASELTRNARERTLLLDRAAACARGERP